MVDDPLSGAGEKASFINMNITIITEYIFMYNTHQIFGCCRSREFQAGDSNLSFAYPNKFILEQCEGKWMTSWLLFLMFIRILLFSQLVSWDRCGT